MNKVFLIGRLTRDPELRYTGSNIPVATFSIAVNRNFTNQSGEREADFINIIAWNKLSEFTQKYLSKGRQILVSGRLQVRDYEKDGHKVYVTEVIAEEIYFADSKPKEEINVNFVDTSDDELPF
jgi:single-strand DNA-binding protein